MNLLNTFWSGCQLNIRDPKQCIIFRPSGTTGYATKDLYLPCFKLVLSHNTVDFDLDMIGKLGALSIAELKRVVEMEKRIHSYTDSVVEFDGLNELELLVKLKYA